jgi:hypothetical protein
MWQTPTFPHGDQFVEIASDLEISRGDNDSVATKKAGGAKMFKSEGSMTSLTVILVNE